jgi:hypothetical protein
VPSPATQGFRGHGDGGLDKVTAVRSAGAMGQNP